MKRVLVTGATGFVGMPLCRAMLATGWHVRGTHRSARNATLLPDGVELIHIPSINRDTDWSEALNGADAVVHLAARVHVMNDDAADPLNEFRQVNVLGTECLARRAAAAGVQRFIYLSSVKVNGEGRSIPYTEQDVPVPEDSYGISKLEAERVLHNIAAETGLEIVILRAPLIYGPGVKANFLRMVKIINRGFPLPLANIRNRRSFIYMDNMVSAILACMSHPRAAGQTYLVSDGEDVSTPELIARLATSLRRPVRLLPFPLTLMRILGKLIGKSSSVERLLGSLSVDSSKIRLELEWTPPYTLDQGLQKTADWFCGLLRRANSDVDRL